MKILHKLVIFGITSSLLFASQQTNKELETKKILDLGQESTSLLLKTLGKNMKEHMKKGGPMDALNFCSNEAFSLTESINQKLDASVSVKRISTKYRSVANAPSEDEAKILNALQTLENAGAVLPNYILQKVDSTTFKYYKPIFINKEVCLKCHGDIQASPLKKSISERYPSDKALGYKLNDLRGAVVSTIKTK